uniref:E3 ubiquitin-protein ligase TRIM21-like n=1 Tax=Haplochromis burtoni TaxID=8153 RepID=A0A3Q2X5M1_HAPBU
MSAASCLLSHDQFQCSICLDILTDPISTPCGHNFCKNFPCDICTETKLKALKSCLVCLASYCQTHLEPHLTASCLKRHQLIDPEENLEGRMCIKHDKPLELFCKTDQTCICMLCSVIDHNTHEFVPLREEYEGKKAELGKTETEIQQMITKRQLKIQEIKESVKMSKDAADREKAEGVQVFTALTKSLRKSLNELIKEIEDKQETTEKQAEGFITDLEQEISELMKRSSEDWTEVTVDQLKETLSKEMKKLFEAELKRVQQYAVDMTLDPDTAHQKLILSDDERQVHCGEEENDLPDNPERFSKGVCVLGKQSLSSGRFYFEVWVKEKRDWILGMVRESVNREEEITLSPEDGYWTVAVVNGNVCVAFEDSQVRLSPQFCPEKVGVFVDYEEGLVSFHDVDDAALIYSFTGCSFTEKLYPFFCPGVNDNGKNSAPLIICPVNQSV